MNVCAYKMTYNIDMAREKKYTTIRINKGALNNIGATLDKMSSVLTTSDTLSEKSSKKADYAAIVQRLNQKLYRKVNAFNGVERKSRTDGILRLANGLARDPFFVSDIAYTRINELGLKELRFIYDEPFVNFKEAYKSLICELCLNSHNIDDSTETIEVSDSELQHYKKLIASAAKNIRERQFLTDDWDRLIVGYLANPASDDDQMMVQDNIIKETLDLDVRAFRTAEMRSITDNEITISFRRNIQRKDYVAIWDVIKGLINDEPLTDEFDLLKNRLVILHEYKPYREAFGLSYRNLAKIYFPEYFMDKDGSYTEENGIEKTKKIIGREKDVIISIN